MVVKMRKWSPWIAAPPLAATATRKFQVKMKPLKLEAIEEGENDEKKQRVVSIKVKWKGEPKFGLMPFYKHKKDFSKEKIVKKGEAIEWDDDDDQMVHTCSFTIAPNQEKKFVPWYASFNILYEEKKESKSKLAVIGRGSVNLAEIVTKMETQIEWKIPINLQKAGIAGEVSLTVLLNFDEIVESQDSVPMNNKYAYSLKEREKGLSQEELIMDESEKSAILPRKSTEILLDSNKKMGWFSWKNRQFSCKGVKTKEEALIKKTDNKNMTDVDPQSNDSSTLDSINNDSIQTVEATECSSESEPQCEGNTRDSWEEKEIVSRDGQTKLKASVFFASFDQCSDKAAGESACTALVAVISHQLCSNPNAMPNMSEFDNLIMEGSSEWRKLCENEVYVNDFPDQHFDLETILKVAIRPMAISREKSFVGFFGAEIFESLEGVMSFDEMWNEISRNSNEYCDQTRIYIISWNDHFFVLKMESDAYYIIDTLGERLFEGCNQAYILRFDSSALMHRKTENEEIICSGKECCREYIKRFLAAIPLKELQEEEEKKGVSYFSLHNRLQIEFNFCYSTPPSSSRSSSLTSSPFSSPATSTSPHFSSE
ncbi:unnamed protein product [Fraxinus pennsylvanica]|uniref:C2 NT-type domain-containing protein n=1 Tax=Fraxinus pennsylvanica TaxID=56036 RepID=A0AAD1ZP47_9LAMI|nr:unnamed protein product [Fraxinus pennsylvanica]